MECKSIYLLICGFMLFNAEIGFIDREIYQEYIL